MKKCLECDSEKIIKDAIAIDRGDYNAASIFEVAVDEKPDAFIFKQRAKSPTRLEICCNCGFIRFFSENPEILQLFYQNRLKNL